MSPRGAWLAIPLYLYGSTLHAQSQVTIYGRINLGVAKESGNTAKLDRGYANWLGFNVEEDLGGGLAATGHLQTRFATDTGMQETSVFWQGESTVGLKRKDLGQMRLGRGLTPLWQYKYAFEPWFDSWSFGSLGKYQTGGRYISNPAACTADCPGFARWNNAVFVDTVPWGDFRFAAAAQLEVEPGAARRGMGFSVNLDRPAYSAMLSWERNTTSASVLFIAGTYRWDGYALMGSIARNTVDGQRPETNAVIGGSAHLGGVHSARAAYGRNTSNGDRKLSVGYVYTLSRRTQLYADLYRERERDKRRVAGSALGVQHNF